MWFFTYRVIGGESRGLANTCAGEPKSDNVLETLLHNGHFTLLRRRCRPSKSANGVIIITAGECGSIPNVINVQHKIFIGSNTPVYP